MTPTHRAEAIIAGVSDTIEAPTIGSIAPPSEDIHSHLGTRADLLCISYA